MAQSNNSNRLVVPGAQNAIDQMKLLMNLVLI